MPPVAGHTRQIERAVLDNLTCGDRERFALAPHWAGAVRVALQASLQSSEAEEEVGRLLQLIVALEQTLESPAVAEGLRTIIRADPDAVALIRRRFSSADVGAELHTAPPAPAPAPTPVTAS